MVLMVELDFVPLMVWAGLASEMPQNDGLFRL